MPLVESAGSPYWNNVERTAEDIVQMAKDPAKQHISPYPDQLKIFSREEGAALPSPRLSLAPVAGTQDTGRLVGQVYVISIYNRQQQTIDGTKPNRPGATPRQPGRTRPVAHLVDLLIPSRLWNRRRQDPAWLSPMKLLIITPITQRKWPASRPSSGKLISRTGRLLWTPPESKVSITPTRWRSRIFV